MDDDYKESDEIYISEKRKNDDMIIINKTNDDNENIDSVFSSSNNRNKPFYEDIDTLERNILDLRTAMASDDYQNIIVQLSQLLDITNQYKIERNDLISACKLEKLLIYHSICKIYNPEEEPAFDECAKLSFSIIKNLIQDKRDGYLFSFIEFKFMDIASENLKYFDENRLTATLEIMSQMITNYPTKCTDLFNKVTLPALIDMITFIHDEQICQLLSHMLFYCTMEGAGNNLSNLLNAFEYLASLRIPSTIPSLLYAASNIINTRKVAICFLHFHNFKQLIDDSLLSDDPDVLSAALILLSHICTWYYTGNHPEDPDPKFNYQAVVRIVDPEIKDDDLLDAALTTICDLIEIDGIGPIMYNFDLLERMKDCFELCDTEMKIKIALIHAKLAKKNYNDMMIQQYEQNGLNIMLTMLESFNVDEDPDSRKQQLGRDFDETDPLFILLIGILYMSEFLASNNLFNEMMECYQENNTREILEEISESTQDKVSSCASMILTKLPDSNDS